MVKSKFVVNSNTVGINLSPLIMGYTEKSDIVRKAFKNLVNHILEDTDYDILFIPHVTAKSTDDRDELLRLYNEINEPNRIRMVDEKNCCEIKNIISQCRYFIGARTHATIAAYSTCVPTLVCGYSIAKDLFGTSDNYVIPVDTIASENELVEAFEWIQTNEKDIREKLGRIMPRYIEKARKAGEIFENVI